MTVGDLLRPGARCDRLPGGFESGAPGPRPAGANRQSEASDARQISVACKATHDELSWRTPASGLDKLDMN